MTLVETGPETMTGGWLKRARDYLDDDLFCFIYGDAVKSVDIGNLCCSTSSTGALPPARFGLLDVRDGVVRGFQKKPTGAHQWINGGFFVLQPSVRPDRGRRHGLGT